MKIAIFDADFILYSATGGNKVLDSFGVPIKENGRFVYTDKTQEEVEASCDFIIEQTLDAIGTTSYIGFLGNSKSFRYDVDPNYKANRKDFCKPIHFKECKDYLVKKWGFTLLNNRLEADDAVNISRNLLKDEYECIIVSPDKDLIKCIEGIYFNPRTLQIVKTGAKEAYINFWTSMICGDTTDNIKGIEGCGPAFAKKLFKDVWMDDISSCLEEDLVYKAYCTKYGLKEGRLQFAKNLALLKIVEYTEGFELPPILQYKTKFEREIDAGEFNN